MLCALKQIMFESQPLWAHLQNRSSDFIHCVCVLLTIERGFATARVKYESWFCFS